MPGRRTFPFACGHLTERQINVASDCLVCWHLFLQSGGMAEDGDWRRETVLEIGGRLVAVTILVFGQTGAI